jgi:hypothetical protein
MTAFERGVWLVEAALALTIVAGVLARSRYRASWVFPLYLASIVIFETLEALWPARYFTWDFWLLKETTQVLLKLGIALELVRRIFRAFPIVRTLADLGFLALLVLVAAAVVSGQGPEPTAFARVLPRVLYGTACVFAAVLALALWYHIPLDPLHKALLTGFVPYLAVFTVAIQLLESFGWQLRAFANYANWIAFVALLSYWARTVWARAEPLDVAPEVLEKIQPWALRHTSR